MKREQGGLSKKEGRVILRWIFLLWSFSPYVRLSWQRDRAGMCGMADEPPAAVAQTDNDSSILPRKGCKNVRHQFRADAGELLALPLTNGRTLSRDQSTFHGKKTLPVAPSVEIMVDRGFGESSNTGWPTFK